MQEPEATVPETRMEDAEAVQNFVRLLCNNDNNAGPGGISRSYKRARATGLIDGNPPYTGSKLKELGRPDACNVNWGTARTHINKTRDIFFDLFAESPYYMSIYTGFGKPAEREQYNRIMSEESDRILRQDERWNYVMQCSQKFMVSLGCGPLFFEDKYAVIPRFCSPGDLKLPEHSKSDTSYWEFATILMDYLPHELWGFIKNDSAASTVGWRVPYTKQVIMAAMPKTQRGGATYDWEYWQQQIKHNAFATSADSKIISVAHCFWKEFDGTITHAIVEQENTAHEKDSAGKPKENIQYLYINVGRFKEWCQVIHPMYFDLGNGTHYSVSGMAVNLYGALAYENRLLCNLADKAFSPKLIFKPATAEQGQSLSLIPKGDYAVLNLPAEIQQTGMAGLMNDGLAMHTVLNSIVANNLAAYEQTWQRHTGNPPTARQVTLEAQESSRVSNSQINRYYEQKDGLYAEIFRRLADPNSTDELAKEFQKQCKKRGVPKDALSQIDLVQAFRVTGQGSRSMRQNAIGNVMQSVAFTRMPEVGQANVVRDFIGAWCGQFAVERYGLSIDLENQTDKDQQAEAVQWLGTMKTGTPPVITDKQNPVIYAGVWLSAAMQTMKGLGQGNPVQGLQFVDVAVSGALLQMQRFAQDPSRQGIFKQMQQMVKELAAAADQAKQQLAKAAQEAQAQAPQQPQMDPETMAKIKATEVVAAQKAKNMALSHAQRMQQKQQIHEQQMTERARDAQVSTAIADAKGASEIALDRIKAKSKAKTAKTS